MSSRSRNTSRTLIVIGVLASVWLVSSEPWGLGVEQLLMFTAPGALLGLGAGWAAHAADQRQWTWVIYRPQTERASHYFEASLSRQFDAVLHYDVTRAVEPLERSAKWDGGEMPETYPTSL